MTLPNFILVGASQAGSTSLWTYLRHHPEVFVPRIKEPNYFAYEGRSVPLAGPGDLQRGSHIIRDWETYAKLFDGVTEETAVGEASVHCLYWPGSAARIAAKLGRGVRIIVSLRDPVAKAHTSWVSHRAKGIEPLTFRDGLAAESERIRRGWACWWHYRRRSHYSERLREFYDHFGTQQIKVFLLEDLAHDPAATAKEMFEFLGVSPAWSPPDHKPKNSNRLQRSQLVARLLDPSSSLTRLAKNVIPASLGRPIVDRIRRFNTHKPRLDPELEAELRAHFHEDIEKTAELVGRDLSDWTVVSR